MNKHVLKYTLCGICILALGACKLFAPKRATAPDIPQAEYAGTQSCIKSNCHGKQYNDIKDSPHSKLFQQEEQPPACEACHGKAGLHVQDPKKPEALLKFARLTAQEISEICIKCHNQGSLEQWPLSRHYQNNVSCISCHQLHGSTDRLLLKANDPQLCYTHHPKIVQEFTLPHKHQLLTPEQPAANVAAAGSGTEELPPDQTVRTLKCSNCHSPHENYDTKNKYKVVVESCLGCHSKYTGPFDFPHEPAERNCAACHAAHGSEYAALCKTSAAELCRKCHIKAPHPFYVLQQEPDPEKLQQKCMKCHPMIHGSKFEMLRKYEPGGGPRSKTNSPRPVPGASGIGGGRL